MVRKSIRSLVRRIPIIGASANARWPQWKEALKEVAIILLFSLMPIWIGLLVATILTITNGPQEFLEKIASSSDLGILAASLLGPLLYMLFRDDEQSDRGGLAPRFPDGLWFTALILISCVVATVIYCFTYLSGIREFFDRAGSPVDFINKNSVAGISWSLFVTSILLVLFASAIRNSIYSRSAQMMNEDTQRYVAELATDERVEAPTVTVADDAQSLISQLQNTQGGSDGSSA